MTGEGTIVNGGNGIKTLSVVISIIAMIIGLAAAIIRPIQQSIDDLNTRMDRLTVDLKEARQQPVPETSARLAEIGKQFVEVETQFRWMRETSQIEIAGHQRRIADIEKSLGDGLVISSEVHARHDERLKVLEKK